MVMTSARAGGTTAQTSAKAQRPDRSIASPPAESLASLWAKYLGLRPSWAMRPRLMSEKAPTIGVVSLGCPRGLVDSERIITRLRSEGYQLSGSSDGADLVVVNTCGFLDSAKAESLDAIGEAIAENGKVI